MEKNLNITARIIYPFIAVFVTALDLFTKHLVIKNLGLYHPVNIIGDFIRFTFTYNTGITFGLFAGANNRLFPVLLISISCVALAVVIYLAINLSKNLNGKIAVRVGRLSLMFIIGGALGNMIDRLMNKAVVDFIDVGIGKIRWYTFNTADSFVVVGGIILGILFIFFEKKKETI